MPLDSKRLNEIVYDIVKAENAKYPRSIFCDDPLLKLARERRLMMASDPVQILPPLPTMEGPPFPDYHTVTLTQRVYLHFNRLGVGDCPCSD